MKEIRFYADRLKKNHELFKKYCQENDISLSYMVKKQLMIDYFLEIIKDTKIYTTAVYNGNVKCNCVNIYDEKSDLDIVDIFDKREGIKVEEIIPEEKTTAIVNFVCGNKKIPTEVDIKNITKTLREKKYKNISLGGTLMMNYKCFDYDEIRIGAGIFVGCSELWQDDAFGFPYEIDCKVVKADDETFLVNTGILDFYDFVNYKVESLCTDWTIFKQNEIKVKAGDLVTLLPDCYTLIKLGHNKRLEKENIKIIGE